MGMEGSKVVDRVAGSKGDVCETGLNSVFGVVAWENIACMAVGAVKQVQTGQQ